ncbi:TLC domain-containing protein [Fusarium keratoplasticum]|uniref:TLC domain-containing protein n=1 Tax=Fusarium keratoplasticum TaxID=1328300 RepID=A0ACC0RCY4_9HYPO|nr:TLC domain-containing protein [Fusarium keratoplasticum]KAI8680021.1 TLC domain-containing protein [Fusarium keratoplasticum]KAI8686102.1 TLC domain-containing protein [Fusarium keratoplasticum]
MSDTSYPAPSQADDKTTIAAPPPPPQPFTSESSIADATVSLQDSPAPTAQQAQQPVPETLESKPAPNSKTANGFAKASSSSAPARTRLKRDNSTPNMNGPLYMQTSGNKTVLVRRLKRKEESTWKHLARWFVENQIGLSFNLLALIFLAQTFIPKAREHTYKFFNLSYYNPKSGQYRIGFDDAYFIAFCIILFTGLRAGIMEHVLAPIGRLQGITSRKSLTRFSEQAWLMVYYTVFWPWGVYIYCTSPHYMSMKNLWTDWPNRELDGLMKGYLLCQWAFWLQQMIVINIEERRKDHWQMFTHHIVTTALIYSCYAYHHTRVGNFILVIMDVVDLFLPLAKCLKYSGFTKLCDVMFGLFVVSWFIARHVLYMMVCWSIYSDVPQIMPVGCFKGTNDNLIGPIDPPAGYSYLLDPFLKPDGLVCYNETIQWAFLAPLLFLQVITIAWFTLIVRVIIKVLKGGDAEDVRSDDEGGDEEEEEDEFVYEEAQPLEEEVGVEELDLRNWERRSGVRKQASSSGVSLPGHSDRKELLGRIGCEKQVD